MCTISTTRVLITLTSIGLILLSGHLLFHQGHDDFSFLRLTETTLSELCCLFDSRLRWEYAPNYLEHPTSTHMVVLLHGLGSKRRSFVPYGPALNEWAHVLLPNIDSSARDVAEKICTDVHFYVSLYHIKTVYFIGVSNGARLLQEVVPCVRDYVEVPRAVALVGPMQGTLGATWLFELLDGLLWHSYHELLGHLQYRPHVNNQELYCDNRTEWLFVASRYDPLVLPHTSALPNSNCSTVLINDRRGHCGTPVAAAPEVLQFIRSSVTVPTLQKT